MDHMSTAAAVGMSNTRMRGDRATQRREEEGGRYWAREKEREREEREGGRGRMDKDEDFVYYFCDTRTSKQYTRVQICSKNK